jgi:hypothetical protein
VITFLTENRVQIVVSIQCFPSSFSRDSVEAVKTLR